MVGEGRVACLFVRFASCICSVVLHELFPLRNPGSFLCEIQPRLWRASKPHNASRPNYFRSWFAIIITKRGGRRMSGTTIIIITSCCCWWCWCWCWWCWCCWCCCCCCFWRFVLFCLFVVLFVCVCFLFCFVLLFVCLFLHFNTCRAPHLETKPFTMTTIALFSVSRPTAL